MAIINIGNQCGVFDYNELKYVEWSQDNVIDGAYSNVSDKDYFLYLTYEGKCLKNRERNGYHDSDFLMLVWDDEIEAPRWIEYASTRGWSYPAYGSWVDATDDVKEKYEAWLVECAKKQVKYERKERAKKALRVREAFKKITEDYNLTVAEAMKVRAIRKKMTDEKFRGLMSLFSKRVRSSFKKSLRKQVIAWAREDNGYETPLSKRQLEFL